MNKASIRHVNFDDLGGHFIHSYLEHLAVADRMLKVFSGFRGFKLRKTYLEIKY